MQIRAARMSHIKWRANAQALVCGFDINQSEVPVIHTSTKLGIWYYGRGQEFSDSVYFDEIESHLILVHQMYMQVYKLVFGEVRRSLFKSKEKVKQENFRKAKQMMMQMNSISDKLVESLLLLEREVAQKVGI